MKHYLFSAEKVLEEVKSDKNGLSAEEAQKRLELQQALELEESQLDPVETLADENDTDAPIEFVPEVSQSETDNKEQQITIQGELSDETTEFTIPQASTGITVAADMEYENNEEDSPRRKRRPYRRRSNKNTTMANSDGLNDDYLEEDTESDLDLDDEDDEDDDGKKYNFDTQRKLLKLRKLFHHSAIQDVIKEGQTILIQIVKEERGNKGAACTTYISLAGRYCVLMPNRIKSGGVSRKITNSGDRKRLKAIIRDLPINPDMSLIVRTAGEDKTKADIVRDYNYLIRTWNAIRYSALKNTPPAMVYEEGNLIAELKNGKGDLKFYEEDILDRISAG